MAEEEPVTGMTLEALFNINCLYTNFLCRLCGVGIFVLNKSICIIEKPCFTNIYSYEVPSSIKMTLIM